VTCTSESNLNFRALRVTVNWRKTIATYE